MKLRRIKLLLGNIGDLVERHTNGVECVGIHVIAPSPSHAAVLELLATSAGAGVVPPDSVRSCWPWRGPSCEKPLVPCNLALQPLLLCLFLGELSLELPHEQAQVAASFIGHLLDFLRFGPPFLSVSLGLLLPYVELREPTSHDLANGDEVRSQMPKVGGELMFLYQLACRFDALAAEMVEQRLAQVHSDRQIGFAWQKFQHSLNGRVQVNLAKQITGPEPEIPGGTRKPVAHGGNNVLAADLGKSEHALIGQETVRMAQVADERRDGIVQPHLSSQVRHQRLQPLAGIVAKVMNLLGKQGHDFPLVLVRLPNQGLNDPQGVAQIEL